MTNRELQKYLSEFPDEMPVRLLIKPDEKIIELTEENILHTSETAYIDSSANEDEWDREDGRFQLGNGAQYLLFNPIIV